MKKPKLKCKKKRSNLFVRYFGISALTVSLGFVFVALAIVFFIAAQWWTDKVDTLVSNSQDIYTIYSYVSEDEELDSSAVATTLRIMSSATDSDYFITDNKGVVLICGDCEDGLSEKCDNHKNMTISKETFERAEEGGFSDYMTDDDFGMGRFVVALPIKDRADKTEAIVFAVEDAVTGLVPYVINVITAILCFMLVALVMVFIAIYFITRGITKPLNEMKEVTTHFAKGEFEYRADENYKKRDFSEFAKALNKMAYELKIDDEAQKSFIANVSHELKTPMTSIGGFIDGILDGTIPPEEEKKYLTIVSNEVKRLSRMVVSMLNLSKIETGEVKLSPQKYDIGKQMFETLLSFEKKIDEKNIEIDGFEDINGVVIEADRDLIQQVIYNLVDNAVKFTPDGGTITLFAKNNDEKTVVTIRNSGAGVDEDEISRIFERFYKVDKSRSFDTKGVGLGLYIVKTIVNMHGGEIIASSKKGEYTEFSFEIPFAE